MTAMHAYLVIFSLLTDGMSAVASATAAEVTPPPDQIKPVNAADLPHPQGPRYQIDPTTDLRQTFPRASRGTDVP